MRRQFAAFAPLLCLIACSAEDAPVVSQDMNSSIDQFVVEPDAPAAPAWTSVRVDDETPAGQGLPLDAVEVCNPVGAACVALEITSTSDDALDYTGATDGANSQDATCSDATFTRMGGTGNFVVLALPAGAEILKGSQVNVWTATSDCPLVEAGDKAFTVTILDDEGQGPVESCAGTCTVSVP